MQDKEPTTIIQTKLNRPPLPVDMVRRPRLTTWLEQCRARPLTLVSAPAGYGKSTLISCWLESVDCPFAWVSLDEYDNKLGSFLSYLLAAIKRIFPEAVPETQAFLLVSPQPPVTAIANTLINELNQIEQPFILVLDDYHFIENPTIHDLLSELLTHPPFNLHLVLGTRMDPSLPLITLRANSQLTEIRIQDLRFNHAETQQLFQKMTGSEIDQTVIREMDDQVEGWVTGLRLAALAMQHRIGRDALPDEISIQNRYVTEYLIAEILSKQARNMSTCMLKISILERFCADLCETVCAQEADRGENGSGQAEINGVEFLNWMQAANLFVIPLDDQHEWFRYHHLFQDFLLQELNQRYHPDEIAKLHAAAGQWYAQNGSLEEALYHLLPAGEISAAIQLIAQERYRLMNNTQWPHLERLLNLFPSNVVETSAELWMTKIWLLYYSGQWAEFPAVLEHLNTILIAESHQEAAHRLAGEISTLNALVAYHSGDANGALTFSRQALELLPVELWTVRVLARNYWGGSLLLTGDIRGAYDAHYGALEEEKVQNRRFKATLLAAACDIHWINADLQGLKQAAKHCIALCQEINYLLIQGFGRSHLGRVHYQWNNLSAAEEQFARIVEKPYLNYGDCYINSVCGLAFTNQAKGRETEARQVTERAIAVLLETGNTTQLPLILALQAEIALMQKDLSTARQLSKKLDPAPPLVPIHEIFAPQLTLVKIWLAQNTLASQKKAAKLLHKLIVYLEDIHNTRFLIEALALQALLDQARGDQLAAQAALERSLRLAQAGGIIRLFVDLGSQMAALISRMSVDQGLQGYIDQINAAFLVDQGAEIPKHRTKLPEPLTNREFQILELLGDRLTNKEIAAQLMISSGTVKSHTLKIYQKLDVNGRRQAVDKAIRLGILVSK